MDPAQHAGPVAGPGRPPAGAGPPPSTLFGQWRSPTRRVVAGVAGGIAERLEVDPTLIRVGFAALALCGGAGVLAYVVLWAAVPEATAPVVFEPRPLRAVAVALMLGGAVMLLQAAGLWLGTTVASSVALVGLGIGVVYVRGGEAGRARWKGIAHRAPAGLADFMGGGRVPVLRIAAGAVLVAGGAGVYLTGTNALRLHLSVVLAVGATLAGIALIAGPWAWHLMVALGEERRERIRSEERAEMAAHLHDSVLQTLALIQRSDQPREMIALARNQERELRAWLSGREPSSESAAATLATAIEAMAATVELQFKVSVEVVTVGDAPLDDRLLGLVEACREATVNAAKHSGAGQISVFAEVEGQAVRAYVRDKGTGFNPAVVRSDRRGISESIRGRMHRSGGQAVIESAPGEGTEVHLTLPAPNGLAARFEAPASGGGP